MSFIISHVGNNTLPRSALTFIEQSCLAQEQQHLNSLPPWGELGGLFMVRIMGAFEHWRLVVSGEGREPGWQFWGNEDVVREISALLLARSLVFTLASETQLMFYAVNPEEGEGVLFPITANEHGMLGFHGVDFLGGSDPQIERRLRRALPERVTHADPARAIARAEEVFGPNCLSLIGPAPDAAPQAEKLS